MLRKTSGCEADICFSALLNEHAPDDSQAGSAKHGHASMERRRAQAAAKQTFVFLHSLTSMRLSETDRECGARACEYEKHRNQAAAKQRKPMEARKVSDSQMEMIYLIRPEHLNGAGRLFGGKLVEWMDELSALVAIRHCRRDVTTVAIDNLRFMCPAYQRDMVVLIGRITHVGTTSMEVRVDVYIEDMNGMRHPINRAYFSVVAMDENERPVEVPGIVIETEAQKAEWEAGEKRREMRLQRKKEGF